MKVTRACSRPGIDRRGVSAAFNCFFIMALDAQADILEILGRSDRAEQLRAEADALRTAAHGLFFNADRRLYADAWHGGRRCDFVSQHTNALAVLARVCPPELIAGVLTGIVDAERSDLCRAGTYFWTYLAEALARNGMHRAMWDNVMRLWGRMLSTGATSWWETFAGDEQDSLCHIWSSLPGYLILGEILGVKPAEPGYGRVCLSPQIGLIDRVDGSVPLPTGRVDLSWFREGDRVRLHIGLAADCNGELRLPDDFLPTGPIGLASHSEIDIVAAREK